MCWTYEEVHAGTEGFSPTRQVGEGGFGVVYRATLKNIECAVKRLKQVSQTQLMRPCVTDRAPRQTLNPIVMSLL